MDRASATKTVFAGSIPVGSNQRPKKKELECKAKYAQMALKLGLKKPRLDMEVRCFKPFEIGFQRQLLDVSSSFGSSRSVLRSHK